MIRSADPDRWNELVCASRVCGENAKALAACRAKALRRKTTTKWTIEIPAVAGR